MKTHNILVALFCILFPIHNNITSSKSLGTFGRPNIPNIVSSSKCVVHIVLQGQQVEPDFLNYSPHPPSASIQLTKIHEKFTWTEKNKYSRPSNNERYQTFCRFVIFYSQLPLNSQTLGVWISSFIFNYFRGGIHTRVLTHNVFFRTGTKFENFYVVVIKDKLHSSTVNSSKSDLLYSIAKRLSWSPTIVPNFAQLILGNDSNDKNNEICVHSPKLSTPSPENLVCYDLPQDSSSDIFVFFKLVVSHPILCLQNSFSGILEDEGSGYDKITNLNQIKSAGSYIVSKILGHDLNITANINKCPEEGREFQRIQVTREVSVMSSFNSGWTSSLVMIESQNFRFLTCFSNLEIEFGFFAKPFDTKTWLGMCLSIFGVSGVILLFERITGRDEDEKAYSSFFHLSYWTTRILLEQGSEIPQGSVEKFGGVRILMGCWLLMATILTNGYRSLAITDLNAPLPAKYPDEFEVISCKSDYITTETGLDLVFSFGKVNDSELCGYNKFPLKCRPDCFALLSKPRSPLSPNLSYIRSPSYSMGFDFLQTIDYYNLVSEANKLLAEMLDPVVRRFPWNFRHFTFNNNANDDGDRSPIYSLDTAKSAVEEDLLLCEKSVYITSQSEAQLYRNHLLRKYPWSKPLHVSKGEYFAPSVFWKFGVDSSHKVVKAFKAIVEVGIYGELHQFTKYNGFKTSNTKESKPHPIYFRPVKITGNIQTVFWLWVAGLLFSIVFELGQQIWLRIS